MKRYDTTRRRVPPRRMGTLAVAVGALLGTSPAMMAGSVPPGSVGLPADSTRFQAALESLRDSLEIEGISAAVIGPDGVLWAGQAGEGAPGVPVERGTVFDAGSVAKMFTAAVVLRAVDEGAMDLDAPIERWLPEAPNAARVTPRLLLTHTSGWADAWSDASLIPRLVQAPMKRWSAHELLAATPPPIGEPGAEWSYSSSGYVALGRIAELATGSPFPALLRDGVLDPLRLERTVHGAYEDPAEPLAHAWLDIDSDGTPEDFTAMLPATSWRTAAGPAGAILTSASELAVFTRAFVTGGLPGGGAFGGGMVGARPEDWVDRPDGNRHGLGVLRIELAGTTLVGHRGNAAGYSAAAWHAPEAGITIAVLTNRHAILVTPVVAALLEVALDQNTGAAETQAESGSERRPRRPLFFGVQPGVTAEPDYSRGSFDLNIVPIVLRTPLTRRADLRITSLANYHFGDDPGLAHAGAEIALPIHSTPRRADRPPTSRSFLAPVLAVARNLKAGRTEYTMALEPGRSFRLGERWAMSLGLQLGSTYLSRTRRARSHLGLKVDIGRWLTP